MAKYLTPVCYADKAPAVKAALVAERRYLDTLLMTLCYLMLPITKQEQEWNPAQTRAAISRLRQIPGAPRVEFKGVCEAEQVGNESSH